MRRRVVALVLAAAVLAATGAGSAPEVAAAPEAVAQPRPQGITRSYYMADASLAAARNLGCGNGDKTGRMSLLFGSPTPVGNGYGATMWGAPNRSTSAITALVQEFIRGYVWCRRSPDYILLIGVGTSNSSIDGRSDNWLRGHGRTWAGMTQVAAAWADDYYPGRVRVYGAMDMEPTWSTFDKARQWIAGYETVAGGRPVHVNNSAGGCPRDRSDNGGCNNGWNQERIWRVAWAWPPALPIPQIYAASGVNARQWHMIDRYGADRAGTTGNMFFFGVMSQQAACRRIGRGCVGLDISALRAHDLMLWFSNSHPSTVQPAIDSPTDIDWHY